MKTFYFIINYIMTLFTTAIFGPANNPFYLKPVRVKRDERPHNLWMRTED